MAGAAVCVTALLTGTMPLPAACAVEAVARVVKAAACVTGVMACVAALVTGVTTLPLA
jgi:hypothetical protein